MVSFAFAISVFAHFCGWIVFAGGLCLHEQNEDPAGKWMAGIGALMLASPLVVCTLEGTCW